MIEVRDLTKRFGDKVAVDHLSFSVEPGRVTGFLGPNGAGKSTTMRLILGLDRPHSGTATIDGKRYSQLARPLEKVGHARRLVALLPEELDCREDDALPGVGTAGAGGRLIDHSTHCTRI